MKGVGEGSRGGVCLGAAAGAAAKQSAGVLVGSTFAKVFDFKLNEGLSAAEVARRKRAEQAAGELTANALILPMLKQLRRSVWGKDGVFSGGIGEKTFGPEFDRQIADRIAQSPKMGVKTVLTERLMNRNGASQKSVADLVKLDVHG